MIYEIRDYYIDPAMIDVYEEWTTKRALPYMRRELDLVGFWFLADPEPEVTGAPLDETGAANVTWIIRWDDIETRNREMGRVFSPSGDEWSEIWKQHPGRQVYRRLEVRFTRNVVAANG
ncbi:MAG: hypothetical protein OXQ29_13985 [Rhodospirillaceae bacterium]|nr:hypothetical protein [Rhodospirillaceae bacterium]